jgi:hypothetical protein
MSLVDAYLRYYRDSSDIAVGKDLLAAIRNYSFDDFFELQKVRPPVINGDYIKLSSGGTISQAAVYNFGNHPKFWLSKIERFIKNPKRLRAVNLLMNRPVMNNHRFTGRLHDIGGYYYTHTLSLEHDNLSLNLLEDFDLVCGEPKLLLYLLRDPDFLKLTHLSISSTSYEPFFPRPTGFYINDNMVDWKTGLNFYHCPYQVRHFLPIFAVGDDNYVYNLLNLSGERFPADDIFKIGTEIKHCLCGRNYLDVEFFPHYMYAIVSKLGYFYDLQLPDQLVDQYKNLQFIKNGNQIDVLYVNRTHTFLNKADEAKIVSTLQKHEIEEFRFLEGHYLVTSGGFAKFSSFFDNSAIKRPYARWPRQQIF